MQSGGGLEMEIGGGVVPLPLDLAHQRVPAAFEKLLYAPHFGRVFLVAASLEAGRQAHFHLVINAAGELRVGMEIVNAAAHLEQVERIVGKLLGGDAGGERPKILRVAPDSANARGDRRSRVRIVEDHLDQRRETQAQTLVDRKSTRLNSSHL